MTRFRTTGIRGALLATALVVCLGKADTLLPAPPSPTPNNPLSHFHLGSGAKPDIYVEENGKRHVAWMNGNTLYYRYYNGSSWESTQTPNIQGISMTQKSPPSVWADGNGKPHIVWADDDDQHVWYINKTGGSWSSPVMIVENTDGPDNARLRDTHIAVASNGIRHVVWRHNSHVTGKGTIWYKKYQNGSWGSKTQISQGSGSAKRPHVALGSDNSFHVVWRQRGGPGNAYEVMYRKWTNGSWGSVEFGTYTPERAGEDTHIALDGSNNAHVSFPEDDDAAYVKRNGSNNWTDPVILGAGEDPVIAIDDNGTIYVAWDDVYRYNDGSGWAGAQVFSEGATEPDAYGDGQYAHIVYQDNNDGSVWYTAVTEGGGPPPQDWIQVTDPNGGEVLEIGSTFPITWTSSDGIDNVKIRYSTNSGSTWTTIVASTANDGFYSWTVPDTPSEDCRVRIVDTSDTGIYDNSDADFTIGSGGGGDPWITVTDPNGGENWQVGTSHTISWNSSDGINNVKIRYSTNGGSSWTTIVESTGNDGSYSWTVPDTPTETAKVRIVDTSDTGVYDVSDGNFTISDGGGGGDSWVTVTSPNGGENWEPGSSHLITWGSSEDFEWVWIDYSTDSGQTWITIASRSSNDGDRDWNIPGTESSNCRLRIRNKDDFSVADMSDADFTIGSGHDKWLTVFSPNGGEVLIPGSTHTVTWDSSDNIDNVKIRYSIDGGSSWTTIVESTVNDGSYSWNVPSTQSNDCRIRIIDTGDTGVYDISDGNFSISEGGGDSWITVTSPNGGEAWEPGTSELITWESSGDFPYVWVDYSTDGGQSWIKIASRTSNDGDRDWNIPDTESDNCLLRIRNKDDFSIVDMSDGTFTIGEGGGGGGDSWIDVTYPDGGEVMEPGTATHITWNSSGDFPYVWVDYSTDGGQTWIRIASRTANDGTRDWTVPDTQSGSCRMRIRNKDDFSIGDMSDADFTIGYPAGSGGKWLNLTSVNDEGEWQVGTNQTIKWEASSYVEEVRIWGSVDSGQNWILLKDGAPNSGTYSLTVPNIPTEHARLKVQDVHDGRVCDTSEQDFAIRSTGAPGLTLQDGNVPRTFELHQNYPNPFNPSTQITFDIPGEQGTSVAAIITIYDTRGRLVKSLLHDTLQPGSYRIHWDGRSDSGEQLGSGIYLLYLRAGSNTEIMKMVLAR